MSENSNLSIDVLVIGGGLQGLHTLNAITKLGYSALLVTKDKLGSGQSLHSHDYIHGGSLHAMDATHVKNSRDSLFEDIRTFGVPITMSDYYFNFKETGPFAKSPEVWDRVGLNYSVAELPDFLKGGTFEQDKIVKLHYEQGVNMKILLQHYANRVSSKTVQGEVKTFVLNEDSTQITSVQLQTHDNGLIEVHPKFVAFATGTGTRALLEQIPFPENHHPSLETYEIVKHSMAHMICYRGNKNVIKAFAAASMEKGIVFIGHHREEGNEMKAFGYISPFQPKFRTSTTAVVDYNAKAELVDGAVKATFDALFTLIPSFKQVVDKLEWTIYAGYKQDINGSTSHATMYARSFASLKNTCVLLPSLLSMVPATTEAFISQLKEKVSPGPAVTFSFKGVEVDDYAANNYKWQSWNDFKRAHSVE